MKNIEKIIADLQTWADEDIENRAISLVGVQIKEGNDRCAEKYVLTKGLSVLLVDAFMKALNIDSTDKELHKILVVAIALQESIHRVKRQKAAMKAETVEAE